LNPAADTKPFKLAVLSDGEWQEHSHGAFFSIETTSGGAMRLVTGALSGSDEPFRCLTDVLKPPFFALYILHTSRGEGDEGRYQSPEISKDELHGFLDRFSEYLSGDARFDLWVYSPDDKSTVVWDRHNYLYAYGPMEKFSSTLSAHGFTEGAVGQLGEHMHHYREEFDADARAMLGWFDWILTPLKPGDEQFHDRP